MVDNMKHQLALSSWGKLVGVLVWTAPNLNDLRLSKKLTRRMSMGLRWYVYIIRDSKRMFILKLRVNEGVVSVFSGCGAI